MKTTQLKTDIGNNIKYVRNRDCFTVTINYENYKILADLVAENKHFANYWEKHPITFTFVSISDKEVHEQESDNYKGYFAYIGEDGDDNLFDLGACGGPKEEIVEQIEKGTFFFNKLEQNPNSFDAYRFNQFKEYMLKKYEFL